MPPTSAPRSARSLICSIRAIRPASLLTDWSRVVAGSSPTWSRIRSSWARSSRIRATWAVASRCQRQLGAQLAGERVVEAARLGQRDRQPARHPGCAVEPAPDQGRDPLPLLLQHPAAVPGGEDQLVAVVDRLPHRQRQPHVAGQLLPTPRRERRAVELVELVLAGAQPGVELGEVALDERRLDGLAELSRVRWVRWSWVSASSCLASVPGVRRDTWSPGWQSSVHCPRGPSATCCRRAAMPRRRSSRSSA